MKSSDGIKIKCKLARKQFRYLKFAFLQSLCLHFKLLLNVVINFNLKKRLKLEQKELN